MQKIALYLLSLTALFMAGCNSPLTREQAAQVHTVKFEPDMDFEMKYRLIGTTVFTNNTSTVEDNDLKDALVAGFREELQKRGYQLVDSKADADIILEISPGITNNVNNMGGIEGMGFHVRVLFSLNPGITAQASFIAKVISPSTGETMGFGEGGGYILTDVTNAADEWSEFSVEEKKELLDDLRRAIAKIPAESLDAVGLVDRHNPPPPDPKYVMPPASPRSRGG